MKYAILFCIQTILNTFIIITVIDILVMGLLLPHFSKKCRLPHFLISRQNRIDMQQNLECSAYSAAYLLRHFGMDASGVELYQKITGRRKDGTVYPKGVRKLLAHYGLDVKYCIGNLNALKNEVSRGTPVIVLIRTRPNKNWLHFVPVVGYDEDSVFIADSLAELANCDEKYYNRKVGTEDFLKLWNTSMLKMPLYRNTFFIIRKSDNYNNP